MAPRSLFLLIFRSFLLTALVHAEKPCHWLGTPPACYGLTPFTCPEGTSELAHASDATNNKFADFGENKCYWGEKTLCCKNEILRLENGVKPKHCEGGFTNGCPAGRIELAVERSEVSGMPPAYTSFCCERDTMVLEKLPKDEE